MSQGTREHAVELALTLLRFEMAAANDALMRGPDGGSLGTGTFVFLPVVRRRMLAEAVAYLAACPSPAILVPSTTKGLVALTLLSELSGERRRWAESTLADYRDMANAMAQQLGLTAESQVLFEFDDETHVFSFGAFCHSLERYRVNTAFTLASIDPPDPRASVRLLAFRSDGSRSAGAACRVRRPDA